MTTTKWWAKNWAVALIAIAATVPLWFVQLPPLIDLLGHMGRYHIQLNLASSPALQANWAYQWSLIGNLGCDLLMELLGRLFGVERGSVVLSGLILILAITGMARLAKAAHGTLPATAWAAFPFAMSYCWQYGLVNYWLGVACALHAAAFFYRPEAGDADGPTKPWMLDSLLLGIVAVVLWVVHIYGWGLFCVLIWAKRGDDRSWRGYFVSLLKMAPLGAPLLIMAALRYGSHGQAETMGWYAFDYKLLALTWTLRDQSQWFDLACLGLSILLIIIGFRSPWFERDRAVGRAALTLLVALFVMPYQLFGSAYADARLWPVVFIVALLALRPSSTAPARFAPALALGAALIFAVRIAVTTVGFQTYDRDYARHLQALNLMPRAAHVAVFVEFPSDVPWRRPRLEHMDGIAIVRRDVFTNSQWEVPGAQLLIPLGAQGTRYNADPSQYIMGTGDLRPKLQKRLEAFPRDRFDLVWLIGYRPETLPRYKDLTPLFADDRTILYRIEK
jgi:hypothetical protein